MSRGQANVLRAFALWTVYVWVTRMWNIWRDDQSVGFKAVHTVLAVVSIAFAVVCWIVVSRVRRRQIMVEDQLPPLGGLADEPHAGRIVERSE